MSVSDPIADFIAALRNAAKVRKESVVLPSSNMKVEIAGILQEEGFIRNYKIIEEGNKKFIKIYFKYLKNEKPALQMMKRVSRPGLRRYVDSTKIPRVLNGLGIIILSTSKGIITGKKARSMKVGGEMICTVW